MSTELVPGVYHIVVAGVVDLNHTRLTRQEGKAVTILPPGAAPEPDQEWILTRGKDGNIIIEHTDTGVFLPSYLTYTGAPEKQPEHGDIVIHQPSATPPNEWHLVAGSELLFCIRVAGSELGIKIAPPKIHPPILDLGHKHQLEWIFQRIRDA